MSKYALIKNNKVVTVVEQETAPDIDGFIDVELPAGSLVGPGYTYDGSFIPPVDTRPRHITKLAFRNRFTLAEKAAMELAALDNPQATLQERSQSALLRAMMKDLEVATFIDLDRVETREGVETLETFGLLGEGRASEILNGPISESDRPL